MNENMYDLLWSRQLTATSQRIQILGFLAKEPKPLSAMSIHQRLKKLNKTCSFATVYRALEALTAAGLLSKMDLKGAGAHYEFIPDRKHHHHAVCTSCGKIEDVYRCDGRDLDRAAQKGLKKFKRIESHSLEFFGLCRICDKAS